MDLKSLTLHTADHYRRYSVLSDLIFQIIGYQSPSIDDNNRIANETSLSGGWETIIVHKRIC